MESCQSQSCSATQPKSNPAEEEVAIRTSLEKIKHKLLVMSGKGGVGKTSVSVNLAIALANKGFQVGLMDVDMHGPDIPRMLGLKEPLSINENRKLAPMRYNNHLSAVSIEALIPRKDDAIIWRGPMKFSVIKQFIGEVDWGELDFLIIDAPPGTGDEPLTIAQIIKDACAVIVTTPQEVALADVRKSINFCKTVDMRIAGLIENMSGCVCPQCGQLVSLFGSGGGQRTALEMNIPFLGSVPFDPRMVHCGDAGLSFQQQYSDSEITAQFSRIADTLAGVKAAA